MSIKGYRIEDEPSPGPLSAIAVNPIWPLVAVMFGGAWISWIWFVLNGFAVGSPTQKREWAWIVVGLIGSTVLVLTISSLLGQGLLKEIHLKYALLSVTVWKLGITYTLFNLQSHTIELYEYYGGKLINGIFILIAIAFVAPGALSSTPTYMQLVLS